MPFSVVRNDIAHMKADVIVNAANERLLAGGGVCGAIFKQLPAQPWPPAQRAMPFPRRRLALMPVGSSIRWARAGLTAAMVRRRSFVPLIATRWNWRRAWARQASSCRSFRPACLGIHRLPRSRLPARRCEPSLRVTWRRSMAPRWTYPSWCSTGRRLRRALRHTTR